MEKIVFVTFNYDRTLEHFLYTAFQHYYGIEDDKVLTRIMNLIEIIHVYGNITHLKWEIGCAGCKVNFGETGVLEFNELQECAGNIKIINEDRASLDKTKAKIHSFVEEAKRVCILGFGFQESNLPLLGIEEYKLKCEGKIIPKKKFFYTKLGLSKGYHEKIFGMLGGSSRANYFDTPIYDFMVHEY